MGFCSTAIRDNEAHSAASCFLVDKNQIPVIMSSSSFAHFSVTVSSIFTFDMPRNFFKGATPAHPPPIAWALIQGLCTWSCLTHLSLAPRPLAQTRGLAHPRSSFLAHNLYTLDENATNLGVLELVSEQPAGTLMLLAIEHASSLTFLGSLLLRRPLVHQSKNFLGLGPRSKHRASCPIPPRPSDW